MYLQEIYKYIDAHSQDFLRDLAQLIRQPSVSAKGEGIQECAEMVEKMMRKVGLSTRIIPEEKGNPVIYGEIKSEASEKTLLFYNHYDVQPPEPLDEWIHGPFSGEIEAGKMYGRGVADNKGNIVSRLSVVHAFLETVGSVPINLKFVIEGEEEIGSPHLAPVVRANRDLFSADAAIWEFGGTDRRGRPNVYLGLKGVLSVELRAKGASRDVHSANAPLVPNPAWRLLWALSNIKDKKDKILIQGFYDNVEPPSAEETKYLKDIPFEVDLVDLFLNPERVPPVVDQAVEIGAPVLWMQIGVIHHEAAQKAREAGLTVIMDRCMMREHKRLFGDLASVEIS